MLDQEFKKMAKINHVKSSVDLTRRRYQLLSETRGMVKDINAINFAFVNINCSLGVRYYNGLFDYLIVNRSFII